MSPGWNLISLPGTPVDADLDSVLPDSMKASRVLQWVNGAFEVNERGSDGTWDASGGVTELVAGAGYWIFTTAFEDIEALIPLPDPSNILPTVAVVGGWNLLGVIDLAQASDNTVIGNADAYLASIEFSVVYSYNTQANAWTRLTNNAAIDSDPAWSPDGSQIAFGSDRDGNSEIYIMNA
ncbi:MAG: PD40 domain-containing protein, partial [Acidobacteria bacterium]|nr:PD40 domain-containing protein [Acidobacteriota bacterium]